MRVTLHVLLQKLHNGRDIKDKGDSVDTGYVLANSSQTQEYGPAEFSHPMLESVMLIVEQSGTKEGIRKADSKLVERV